MIQGLIVFLGVVIGTWNGDWFPSGRAEHRAHPEVEAATIHAAGGVLSRALNVYGPAAKDEGAILVLNEIRNRSVAESLLEEIVNPTLKLAEISAYRRRDRFDQQQDVIATTLPVLSHGWSPWAEGDNRPPRGFVFADVLCGSLTARVYAVHLKSEYGATTPEMSRQNRLKRTLAVEELLRHCASVPYVILAGDLNADCWHKSFSEETIFTSLAVAGFTNLTAALPARQRGTYPTKRRGNRALDYIFVKGLPTVGAPVILPSDSLSDHSVLVGRISTDL